MLITYQLSITSALSDRRTQIDFDSKSPSGHYDSDNSYRKGENYASHSFTDKLLL